MLTQLACPAAPKPFFKFDDNKFAWPPESIARLHICSVDPSPTSCLQPTQLNQPLQSWFNWQLGCCHCSMWSTYHNYGSL